MANAARISSRTFLEILRWVPRTDDPDDGIDLSVEIPAQENRPCERFLVQVKTAGVIKSRKSGDWPASIKRSASQKYQRSRHAVFLFRVDLQSSEMRWLNLSEALWKEPERLTFLLPPAQKFEHASADALRAAVREAIAAQDDRHHSPKRALAYRAERLAAKDPRLAVQGEIVGGMERYTFTAKETFHGRIAVVPKTRTDFKQIVDSYAYGSKAQVKVKAFRVEGSPAFERDGPSASRVTIEPYARKFRLGIVINPDEGTADKMRIEMDAELAHGSRGWEVRSADLGCPLELVLRLDNADDDKNKVTISIAYERWNGRPFTELPILEKLIALARCFESRGKLIFEWIEFGERREMLSTEVQANRTTRFKNTVGYLKLLSHVSHICRQTASLATYNIDETIDPAQIESFVLAYNLIRGEAISFNGFTATLTLTEEGRSAMKDPAVPQLQLLMPLCLQFGKTFIGQVPVRVAMDSYSISENADGTFTLKTESQAPAWLYAGASP